MSGELIYERSVLYNIEPIGIGNKEIESFTSYLIRVSNEHNVTVGHLLNKLVFPKIYKEYLKRSSTHGGNRFYEGAKTLNGYMENSIQIVGIMETLTSRRDLSNLTLYKWKDFIPLRNLLKGSLSWCPKCIRGWELSNDFVYYPLIWNLKEVKACLKHNRFLIDKCPKCNLKVDILRRRMIPGYCSNCFSSLAEDELKERPDLQELKWQTFVIQNIEDLLTLDNIQLPTESFRIRILSQLNLIKEKSFSGNIPSFSNFLKIPTSTLRYWLIGKSFPSLDNLLLVCFKLNKRILNLLQEPDLTVDLINYQEISKEKIDFKPRKQLDYVAIENKLREFLSNGQPVSMNVAAKLIGHDRRVLYYNFPEYCKEISKRYNAFVKGNSDKRIEMLKEEIYKAFYSLKNKGVYPSRRKIEQKVNKEGLLKEKVLQSYWKSLLEKSSFTIKEGGIFHDESK